MKTFLGLFRGINVGGKNKLLMKDLVALMEDAGLENVGTYIQSGNVVFQSDESDAAGLAAKIQAAIQVRHGLNPELILLDQAQVDRAIAENPFPEADAEPKSVHLSFLSAPPGNPDLEVLEEIRRPTERFALKGRVFYLHAPEGIGRSKLAARVERAMGVSATGRNWRTVLKLQEMIEACGAGF